MTLRHCPICKDEIPATAHRLKKLCGKQECMLEQQRISGRKSYNRIHGHSTPEPRRCVVCSSDISELRGNRVVCLKPECKETIVKRTKEEWYQRNAGTGDYKARVAENQAKYRASNRKPRNCQVCRDDIRHLAPGARICLKQSCEDYRNRLRAQKYAAARPIRQVIVKLKPAPKPPAAKPRPAVIKPTPKPAAPKIDTRYQRKPTESMKPTIRRKPVVERRVIADDEPWTPRVFNIPSSMPLHTPGLGTTRPVSSFDDLWSCAACRSLEALCGLHQSMTDDGTKPPKVNQY